MRCARGAGARRRHSRRRDAIAVLGQVLADQIADVAMIVDERDMGCGVHGVVQPTNELMQRAESRSGKSLSECVEERSCDTR